MTPKVLIVDDNVYLNHLLQGLLADEGYEVDAARYAGEGYSAYLRKRPDVILTDIHMPGGSGLEMMTQIRRHDPEVRAIYMSGDWERLQSAMKEEKTKPFVKSLRKPFFQQELMRVLFEVLPMGTAGAGGLALPPRSPQTSLEKENGFSDHKISPAQ